MIETLVVATILLAIIAFFVSFFSPKKEPSIERRKKKRTVQKSKTGRTGFCPICNTDLFDAEKVFSVVYDVDNKSDRRCHINGCPHCYPKVDSPQIKRICPVCKQTLPTQEYLITRMFDRSGGKQHIHVVGCSICHKKAASLRK